LRSTRGSARDLAAEGTRAFDERGGARALLSARPSALREGDRLVQPDLARTLELYAREGETAFYRGRVARAIVDELARSRVPEAERGGAVGDGTGRGWITLDDLASYRSIERTPLKGWFRGMEIVTMPLPSSGGVVLLQWLGILEGLPLEAERGHTLVQNRLDASRGVTSTSDDPGLSERMVHWWIEAARCAFADRAESLGDPEFWKAPIEELLSPEWIAERRIEIGERANLNVEPWKKPEREGGETTHLSVLDQQGNACSLTTTLNTTFGSGILVRGAGFLLDNEMDDFAIQKGSPNVFGLLGGAANEVAPRKRPLSSMTPTVLRDGGHLNVMVLGSPGGPRIISAVAQVFVAHARAGAIARSRRARAAPASAVEPGRDRVRARVRRGHRRRVEGAPRPSGRALEVALRERAGDPLARARRDARSVQRSATRRRGRRARAAPQTPARPSSASTPDL
jgi:gamma-glutamyltranspeptidase/glutathione hydrolase